MNPALTLEQGLTLGGDARIALDPATGRNPYGCPPRPAPGQAAFGSATASTISAHAYAAAEALRLQLAQGLSPEAAAEALRTRLAAHAGAPPGSAVILGASGTDLHLLAALLPAGAASRPRLLILPDAAETGTGVPAALQGLHPSGRAALAGAVPAGQALAGLPPLTLLALQARRADGAPVPRADLDAQVERAVDQAAAAGRRCLLVLLDQSKTGLLAPSPACALGLLKRHPGLVDVLVDACQWRLSPGTLAAYLGHGFMVALSGSKAATGPAFSGALLLPPALADLARSQALPRSLAAYSAQADWPAGWAAHEALTEAANLGLLLRWEAALAEVDAFRALDPAALAGFLGAFGAAVQGRLAADGAFEALAVPPLDRAGVAPGGWDRLPTLFPFLLRRGARLSPEASAAVYRGLLARGVQVGQPVRVGDGSAAALRLSASMRLAVEALGPTGPEAVIARALDALDQAARLAAAGAG